MRHCLNESPEYCTGFIATKVAQDLQCPERNPWPRSKVGPIIQQRCYRSNCLILQLYQGMLHGFFATFAFYLPKGLREWSGGSGIAQHAEGQCRACLNNRILISEQPD
jgi:hypothetical protein